MESIIVFPLLLAALGIVFGICLRLSIAVGQLRAYQYIKPLKTFELYIYYMLAAAICITFYSNAPMIFVKSYGVVNSVNYFGLWMEASSCLCLCVSSFLGLKIADKVLTTREYN